MVFQANKHSCEFSQTTFTCAEAYAFSLCIVSLNTTSLTWSTPNPPFGFEQRPPPRSAAIGGIDIAASK
jgi:hypothetical protein